MTREIHTVENWDKWMEIQFQIAHRVCTALDGERFPVFEDFAEAVLASPKASKQIEVITNRQVTAQVRAMFPDNIALAFSVLQSVYKHHQWGAYGFNVFSVSPGLCQRLLLTDPSSAPLVPMPYETFLIRLPPGGLKSKEGGWVRGIWLHRSERREQREGFSDGPLVIVEPMSADSSENPFAFQAPWEDLFKLNITVVNEHGDNDIVDVDDEDIALTKRSAALAANLCFYLASAEGRKESTGLAPKTKHDQRPGFNWPRCWGLGKKLAVDPRLHGESVGDGSERTKLKFKHIVRGHWRNQACGEGLRDHKVIWIQPYWKGPDVEDAWSHAYEVK